MSKDSFLREARERASSDPISTTIRELLGNWRARGRGHRVVAQIRADLMAAGLHTVPDFGVGHIDNTVRLLPHATSPARTDGHHGEVKPYPAVLTNSGQGDLDIGDEPERDQFLRVDSLRCAAQPILSIAPDKPIEAAMTEMALRDYSQLAVFSSPRTLRGAVTWESIGRMRLTSEVRTVQEATVAAVTVRMSEDLLPLLPSIATAGFVLIADVDRSIVGIITAADVTDEFGALAEPFFLLGDIERRLRSWIRAAAFSVEDYAAVRHEGDGGRQIEAPEDLTLGEVERLLQDPKNWERMGWRIDRRTFLVRLGEVREIRNALMHFSSDLPSAADVAAMRHMAELLRGAKPQA